jgi:catechol 2,3-dioxygenase-like lactoylglutathione lyase family enzyme
LDKPKKPIHALGEIALRVGDLGKMRAFYEHVIGLELFRQFGEELAFFKLAPGFAGHTQVLALFAASMPPDHPEQVFTGLESGKTTLHHIAFSIARADFEVEKSRLEGLGLVVNTMEHEWVHWRSLYVVDPEGNLVELVCYDESG